MDALAASLRLPTRAATSVVPKALADLARTGASPVLGHLQAAVREAAAERAPWLPSLPVWVAGVLPELELDVARAVVALTPVALACPGVLEPFVMALPPLEAPVVACVLAALADGASLAPRRPAALSRVACERLARSVKLVARAVDVEAVKHLLVLFEVTRDSFCYRAARAVWSLCFAAAQPLVALVLAANPALQRAVLAFYLEKAGALGPQDVLVLLMLHRHRRDALQLARGPLAGPEGTAFAEALCEAAAPELCDALVELFAGGAVVCTAGAVALYRRWTPARGAMLAALLASALHDGPGASVAALAVLCRTEALSLESAAPLLVQALDTAPRANAALASQLINALLPAVQQSPVVRAAFVTAVQGLRLRDGRTGKALAASAYASLATLLGGNLSAAERADIGATVQQVMQWPSPVARVFYRRLWTLLTGDERVPAERFATVAPLLLARVQGAGIDQVDRHLLCTVLVLGASDVARTAAVRPLAQSLLERVLCRTPPPPVELLGVTIDALVEAGPALVRLEDRAPPRDVGALVRTLFGRYLQARGTGLGQRALWALFQQQVAAQEQGKGAPTPLTACATALRGSAGQLALAVRAFLMARSGCYDEFVELDAPDLLERWEAARVALLGLVERCATDAHCSHVVVVAEGANVTDAESAAALVIALPPVEAAAAQAPTTLVGLLCEQLKAELLASVGSPLCAAYVALLTKLAGPAGHARNQRAVRVLVDQALAVVPFGAEHGATVRQLVATALALLPPRERVAQALRILSLALHNNDQPGPVCLPLAHCKTGADSDVEDEDLLDGPSVRDDVTPYLEEACVCLASAAKARAVLLDEAELLSLWRPLRRLVLRPALSHALHRASFEALVVVLRRLVAVKATASELLLGCVALRQLLQREHLGALRLYTRLGALLDTLWGWGVASGVLRDADSAPDDMPARKRPRAPSPDSDADDDLLTDRSLAGFIRV